MYGRGGVYVEKGEEVGVQNASFDQFSDSSHPLPTRATLYTTLVDKLTQLERHKIL